MTDDGNDSNAGDTRTQIMGEILVLEISVAAVRGGLHHIKHHPGSALVRNQLEAVETLAREAAESLETLRDALWLHLGVDHA